MTRMVRVADAVLRPDAPQPGRVLAGDPVSSSLILPGGNGKVAYGIWQIMPGQAVEVAPRGMFVILSGRATVAVDDGPTYDLGPGDVCFWDGGERTVWTVHETVRKIYQITTS
jgi:uncharacterized protein